MKILAYICAACFLSACTTHFSGTKPGGDQAQFSNDFLECQAIVHRGMYRQ